MNWEFYKSSKKWFSKSKTPASSNPYYW